MGHALLSFLTDAEREQARQIWDLLERGDGLQGFQALKTAPQNIRVAIFEVAESTKTGSEPEANPFT